MRQGNLVGSVARTVLHAAYILVIPAALIGVFIVGFVWLADIEEYDGERVLTVYGSPVNVMFVGAAVSPLVLLAYLAYWLACFLSNRPK